MENNIKIYANSSSVKNKKDQRFEYIRAIAAIAVVIITYNVYCYCFIW